MDDDALLLTALREGDNRVFDRIVLRYYKSIFYFVNQNVTSYEDAEELTQDIFVKLWKNSQKVEIVSLKNFLYTLARNTIIDYIRRNVNRMIFEYLTDDSDIVADDSDIEDKEAIERLHAMVGQYTQSLPDRQREVYHLRWEDGLSRKKIAAKMGITVTTVDIHLRKAVENLISKFTNSDSMSFN
jgi:RNA polymerase sigma-70 factor (ECF subfamily)